MKYFFALTLKTVLVLLIILIAFFLWASSANLNEEKYTKLIVNKHKSNIDNDSIYSIITYNIGYLSGMTNNKTVEKPKTLFVSNLKKVLDRVKNSNPDIFALQEIDYNASRSYGVNQEEALANLGYNYVARGINWDKRYLPFPYWPPNRHFGKVISGQSILSKYKMKEYKRVVLERVEESPFFRDAFYLERLLQIVKVEIEGKEIVLMNVHLEAFDKNTRIKQLKKVGHLFQEYAKSNPTILLGDFNSDPKFKDAAIKTIFNLSNIGSAAFLVENYENTFDSEKPNKRLDYIFYTKKTIEYIDGKVLNEFGQISDHLPVEMKFKLK